MSGDNAGKDFELYKLLVEEAREARRARRELSNIFTTINLAGAGFIAGALKPQSLGPLAPMEVSSDFSNPIVLFPVALALFGICVIWGQSAAYYSQILKVKYEVIYDQERVLKIDPIQKEWEMLKKKKGQFFAVERTMPFLFGSAYLGVALFFLVSAASALPVAVALMSAVGAP